MVSSATAARPSGADSVGSGPAARARDGDAPPVAAEAPTNAEGSASAGAASGADSPGISPGPAGPSTATATEPASTATPAPAVLLAPVPPATEIAGVTHVWQKWNNCGPSSVLMALSAHGLALDQLAVAARLKPDREDTNVTPEELARFVGEQGYTSFVGLDGRPEIVKRLVASGIPVVAEQWIDVEGRGEMGHYRVITGYDDVAGEFIVQDSYYGARRRHSYESFAREWRPFLGAYVAVARPDQEPTLLAALGPDTDQAAVLRSLRARLESEVASGADDAWAWYTLGEALSRSAAHEEAVSAFERAIAIGLPTRAFWYQFGFLSSLVESGRAERAVAHADATIATMSGENLEESHYWRGLALESLGREEEARASFMRALEFNPLYEAPRKALDGAP
jgi:hypothetical protein